MKSIMQDKKEFYITHQTGRLHEHHIFFGTGERKLSEKYGLKVWLIPELHTESNEGVHCKNGLILNMELKKQAQRDAMKYYGWTVKDFIRRFGKNYL